MEMIVLQFQAVTMYVDMDGEYDKKPDFDFYPTAECRHGSTCVKLIEENDSIYFNGKLTAAVTEYTATPLHSPEQKFQNIHAAGASPRYASYIECRWPFHPSGGTT